MSRWRATPRRRPRRPARRRALAGRVGAQVARRRDGAGAHRRRRVEAARQRRRRRQPGRPSSTRSSIRRACGSRRRSRPSRSRPVQRRRAGDASRCAAIRDQRFEGRIERISPAADPATRQVPIFVHDPQHQRPAGGRACSPKGRVDARSATGRWSCRTTAVNENGDTPWVLRVRDGKVERVDVTLGLRDEQTERVEITSRRRRRRPAAGRRGAGHDAGHAAAGPALSADRRRTESDAEPRGHVHLRFRHHAADRHHRADAGARRSSASSRCCALKTDEFPEVSPPIVSVSIPYPGASPDTVEREVDRPDRGADLRRSAASSKIQSQLARQLRRHHRRVRVLEEPAGSDAGHPRRASRRSATICRREMEEPILTRFDPNDFPIVPLTLTSNDADRRRS